MSEKPDILTVARETVSHWEHHGRFRETEADKVLGIPKEVRLAQEVIDLSAALAEQIARRAHIGQTEQSTGDDYIHHIERVVALTENTEAKAIAWLHDVIEDTAWTADRLLTAGIAPSIVAAVLVVTRDKERESYAEYIQRVQDSGNELALAVKLADLKDHLRPGCPERLRPRYEKASETLTARAALDGKDLGGLEGGA